MEEEKDLETPEEETDFQKEAKENEEKARADMGLDEEAAPAEETEEEDEEE